MKVGVLMTDLFCFHLSLRTACIWKLVDKTGISYVSFIMGYRRTLTAFVASDLKSRILGSTECAKNTNPHDPRKLASNLPCISRTT
jgi:hypothetical protein